jgi:hypothetical protein
LGMPQQGRERPPLARGLLKRSPEISPRGERKRKTVVLFAIGLMAGIALGMIIVGFLAIGAYERGFSEALERRKAWRTELVARTVVGTRALVAARKAS